MKNQCHKGLLIPWLRNALDKNLFEGLGWVNEEKGIFFVLWTHKSAEHWSIDVLEPFRAWAEFKGKLCNKNPKQLKATFRCALNSKKDELSELKREKNRRIWQFKDPMKDQGKLSNKKGPKPNSKKMAVDNRVGYALFNSSVDSSAEAEIFGSSMLPSFESFGISFFNSAQYEDNEMIFNFADFFKSSEEKTSKRKKRRTECKPIDNIPLSIKMEDVENQLANCISSVQNKTQKQSRTDKLPPFQSICNYQPLTPPYQDNEILFSSTECSIGINSPDASRLTPPLDVPSKIFSIASRSSPYRQQLSTDAYQPIQTWSISSTQQSFNSMNPFSNDFDELSEKPRGNKEDFAEMDQFVPVLNMDNQALFRDEAFSSFCKPVPENNQMYDQMKLEDLIPSDYSEAFQKLFQELNSLST